MTRKRQGSTENAPSSCRLHKEMNEKNQNTEAYTKPKLFSSEWFDNFWYHYKWHTVVSVFLIVAILVCTLQMCQRVDYDTYILYAGSKEIKRNGGEYATVVSSMKRVCDDYDKNSEISVMLKDLYMLSNEEIEKIEKDEPEKEVNYALLEENNRLFLDLMVQSDYYVCILSKSLYDSYETLYGVPLFVDLTEHANITADVEMYTNCAIFLNSTGFDSVQGIDFPEDTVICLRALSQTSNSKRAKTLFQRAKDVVENIANYGE